MIDTKDPSARLRQILATLRGDEPDPAPGLHYDTVWQLAVATLLSAQCTDVRVNKVTPGLFARYPGPAELADAEVTEVEQVIRSIGIFRNKARNLVALGRRVVETFGGEVPSDREGLESLPGVGRKTASVVLAQGFGQPAFAVDTHMGRVCTRMGFSDRPEPLTVERHLTPLLDPADWGWAHLVLIRHGRTICRARKSDCPNCPVRTLCPWPTKEE